MDDRPPEDDEPEDGTVVAAAEDAADAGDLDELHEIDGLGEHDPWDDEGDEDAPRRTALPRRVESWRSRSMTGAVMSAMAMGLQQVFAPEKEKPAIVQEAPSDPYDDDDPVVVDYVADDAPGTTVTLRPWLMKTGDSAEEQGTDAP